MYRFTSKQYTDKLLRYRLARATDANSKKNKVYLVLFVVCILALACLVRVRAPSQARAKIQTTKRTRHSLGDDRWQQAAGQRTTTPLFKVIIRDS